MGDYEIESWYPYLKEYTFKSTFLPLSEEEGRAIQNHFEETYKGGSGRYTEQDKLLVSQLENRLEEAVQEFKTSNQCDGVFLKFSLRSPKDSTLSSKRMEELLIEELSHFGDLGNSDNKPEITASDRMISFVRAQSKSLKVSNGHIGMETFLSSHRIYSDLIVAFLEDTFNVGIVLREWNSDFRTELEFRGFVFGKKFTALTQYYELLCIPFVIENHEMIEEKIVSFWEEKMRDLVPMDNYTIDFGLTVKDNNIDVVIIELNPPAPRSGTALFDEFKDKEIIKNGPFEFRFVKTPQQDAEERIHEPLKELMDNIFPKYAEKQEKERLEAEQQHETPPTQVSSESPSSCNLL